MKRLLHALAAPNLLFAALDAHTEPLPTASDKIAVGAYQVQVGSAGSGRDTVISNPALAPICAPGAKLPPMSRSL